MNAKENIHLNGQKVLARRTAIRVATVTVVSMITFLAVWPTTSAEVTQSGSNLPTIGFGGASLAGGSEKDDRAEKGDRLARDYSEWLSASHRRAGVTAEMQPLPAQF